MARQLDWQTVLVDGYEPMKKAQRLFRHLPRDPRCKMCQNPFAGFGGRLVGWMGRKPSRKNPNLCQYCFDHLPSGGMELDIGVIFADIRGSTALGEQASPTDFAKMVNRFYQVATATLIAHDALIDKLIGDEVMALLVPGLAGKDYRRSTARSAIALARAVGDLPVGVAAHAGVAFVGNVGSGTVTDFTALGDAVNVGARLQSVAGPGEVVLSRELYALVADDYPDARLDSAELRGRDEPIDTATITV